MANLLKKDGYIDSNHDNENKQNSTSLPNSGQVSGRIARGNEKKPNSTGLPNDGQVSGRRVPGIGKTWDMESQSTDETGMIDELELIVRRQKAELQQVKIQLHKKELDYDQLKTELLSFESRGSRDASNQLKQNNPNIAEIRDTNRPTKLAESFSELYDNEWTNAYEALHNNLRLREKTTTELLLSIVKGAYKFCTENAELQMFDLQMCCKNIVIFGSEEDKTDDILNDKTGDKSSLLVYRKSIAGQAVNRLQKKFCGDSSNLIDLCSKVGIKAPSPTGPMVLFANKCVELCWWMCVQDPAICLDAATDPEFNTTMYRSYTKSSTSVDFYVWPALILYKGGPVLMKGVAKCK